MNELNIKFKKSIESVLELNKIETSIKHKQMQISQNEELIKLKQNEIKELECDISTLIKSKISYINIVNASNTSYFVELSKQLNLDEDKQEILFEHLKDIIET
jgi:hypothetical protein